MKIIKIEIKAFGTLKNFVLKPKDNLCQYVSIMAMGKYNL